MAFAHYADVDQSQQTAARTRWETILASPLPPNALLVSDDRNIMMPMWYFQYVGDGEPLRADLLGLFPSITPAYPTLGHVLDLALSTQRPVYLVKEMPGLEVKVEVEAEGSLWRVIGPAAGGEPTYPRQARLGDAVTLAGYDRSPHSPPPGGMLEVQLYWEPLRPLEATYHTFVHVLGAAGQVVAQSDRQPGGIYYPSPLWQPGELLRDDHVLNVPANTPQGVYRLLAGMYTFSNDGDLVPLDEPIVIGQLGIKTEVQTESGAISHPTKADFAGEIELLGFDATSQAGFLVVTLNWRCTSPPRYDYTVFVHLLDATGETISQHDGQPQAGAYPTSIWDTEEAVVDEHLLPLPAELPAGNYQLRVGLYRLETGERLPVEDNGDSVELGPIKLGH
jgi:hypothetical protein